MREVDQLIMIIPAVLNLQGNLEMNLSARLSTAANIGELDDPVIRRAMLIGNWTLLQVQAISVSFIAACLSLLLGQLLPRSFEPPVTPASTNSTIPAIRQLMIDAVLEVRKPVPHGPMDPSTRNSTLAVYVSNS